MEHWADRDDEAVFARLEDKTTQIRKELLGALLLAGDLWKEELSGKTEGLRIMESMEAAEDSFPDRSQPDRGRRLEETIDVIRQRARTIFDLLSYITELKQP